MSKFGPRPARSDRRERLSAPRRAVLDLLVEHQDPMTVAQVAEQLGQHPNTVREHLEALVRTGLAMRDQRAPVGRGRPASVYTYAPEASFSSPEYAVLAQVLVSYLSNVLPDGPVLRHHSREAGRSWGRAILEREPAHESEAAGAAPRRGSAAAVEHLRRLLDRTGFDPETERNGDVRTVRLYRCPVLELAKDRPEVVCNAHLGMAREILAEGDVAPERVTLEAFTEPGACLLHVTSSPDGVPPAPRGWARGLPVTAAEAEPVTGVPTSDPWDGFDSEGGLTIGPHREMFS
ncbi:helix-turn-helix domain-containing protein [Georgenia yuyongxinii]|uniref:Helix-turn-helix domain-containing protein n=1 Tax=Georgenia yuyongxinii TaxID=2589797 RepID=A0A5B8C879_9MICO|nr:helix-turn-helix domain-containing protein [Georgenia yuyongxinii]QDC25565.1 helix-turn-helix domain-containing protein [Georgenia yuyongxinii]